MSESERVCAFYQVCGASQREQGQTEGKVLVDDEVTQVRWQHNPTHTQQVGDRPWVLMLQGGDMEVSPSDPRMQNNNAEVVYILGLNNTQDTNSSRPNKWTLN